MRSSSSPDRQRVCMSTSGRMWPWVAIQRRLRWSPRPRVAQSIIVCCAIACAAVWHRCRRDETKGQRVVLHPSGTVVRAEDEPFILGFIPPRPLSDHTHARELRVFTTRAQDQPTTATSPSTAGVRDHYGHDVDAGVFPQRPESLELFRPTSFAEEDDTDSDAHMGWKVTVCADNPKMLSRLVSLRSQVATRMVEEATRAQAELPWRASMLLKSRPTCWVTSAVLMTTIAQPAGVWIAGKVPEASSQDYRGHISLYT